MHFLEVIMQQHENLAFHVDERALHDQSSERGRSIGTSSICLIRPGLASSGNLN
ncbi:hypothetical protein SAMN04490189_3240 [Pseudomonas koreensis]|nr:hypothetical protein SAMN04490189_3240 [Pseudomonas koreensis]